MQKLLQFMHKFKTRARGEWTDVTYPRLISQWERMTFLFVELMLNTFLY
jgi:hypothetical protein